MKCPAKVRQALATHDGRALVVGYEDGAVQMFLIVDHSDPTHVEYLRNWRRVQLESYTQANQQDSSERQAELMIT
jgi:hypothetical protein